MNIRKIVIGQKVNPAKKERAKEFRRNPTSAERILWFYLRSRKMAGYKFRRQQVIAGFIVDFYCHELGLIIEVDGGIHHARKVYDAERDRIIQSRGLTVIRITNDNIQNELYPTLLYLRETCIKLKSSNS